MAVVVVVGGGAASPATLSSILNDVFGCVADGHVTLFSSEKKADMLPAQCHHQLYSSSCSSSHEERNVKKIKNMESESGFIHIYDFFLFI